MIIGLGFDMTSVLRIRRIMETFGERFLCRILTEKERKHLPSEKQQAEEYAASRFAAKEAAVKALSTAFTGGISFQDIEIEKLPSGKPRLLFYNKVEAQAKKIGVTDIHLSLTHEREMAGAVVILEKNN